MGKLKVEKKALEKFVANRSIFDKQIADYEDAKNGLYEVVSEIENEILMCKKSNEDMKYGRQQMDAVEYLQNENKIVELTAQLEKAKADYNTFSKVGEKMKEDVYTPLLDNKGDVDAEFRNNAVAIQKEMFKALKTVEEMCNLLTDLSEEYREEFRYIPHSKAKYCNFDYMAYITTVLSRFGIVNRGKIGYTQSLTTDLYEFEK